MLLLARILTGLCTGTVLMLGASAVLAVAQPLGREAQATLYSTLGIGLGLAGGPLVAGVVVQFLPAKTVTVFVIEGVLLVLVLLVVLGQPDSDRSRSGAWLPSKEMDSYAWRMTIAGLGVFGTGMTAASIILALAPTLLKEVIGLTGALAAGLVAGGM